MTWLLATVLKPFGAFVLLTVVAAIAYLIAPLIPSGRVKTILYDRTLRDRKPWHFGFAVLLGYAAFAAFGFFIWSLGQS